MTTIPPNIITMKETSADTAPAAASEAPPVTGAAAATPVVPVRHAIMKAIFFG